MGLTIGEILTILSSGGVQSLVFVVIGVLLRKPIAAYIREAGGIDKQSKMLAQQIAEIAADVHRIQVHWWRKTILDENESLSDRLEACSLYEKHGENGLVKAVCHELYLVTARDVANSVENALTLQSPSIEEEK